MNWLHRGFFTILLLALTISAGCGGGSGSGDDNTIHPRFRTKAGELNYITKLSSDDSSGVISGQNCRNGNEIANGTYEKFIEKLYQQSGRYVGMIGIDYEYSRICTLAELKQANTYLKRYWNQGGLVTITWSAANPWGTAKNWSDIQPKKSPGNLEELTTPGNNKYDEWIASLDRIAAALTDLKQAGVVVLWRPMQEMNGYWFWWGNNQTGDGDKYKKIWRHMHDYFTNTKGLDNLIWVFSPSASEAATSLTDSPYPGNEYVDIIAPTRYNDSLDFDNGYKALVQLGNEHGKPIAIAEYGPDFYDSTPSLDGNFDNTLYVRQLKDKYPKIAYWVTWESWEENGTSVKMALADNLNASQLLNNPYVINRDNL